MQSADSLRSISVPVVKLDTFVRENGTVISRPTKNPDEFSTPDSFALAMKGASEYIGVNLDIGHFTAAGGDAVAYLREHHDKIVTLHIKDRKKDHGANLPFGQGDTPIGPVLRMLRDNGWKIPANIEYEYGEDIKGLDAIAEVKKCLACCKKELEVYPEQDPPSIAVLGNPPENSS